MMEFLTKLLDTSDFPARWHCGNWTSGEGWLHILSDVAIFGAYAAIPAVLVFFIHRRKDIPFLPVFWLFAGFILFCGTGHFIEATIFWYPWYRLSGLVKLATALISWATVFALIRVIPAVLTLPGLARLNTALEEKVQLLKTAEQKLQTAHDELEERVKLRTADLEQVNKALHLEVAERSRAEKTLHEAAADLERFNQMMIGREQRMIELKREVNTLARKLGQPDSYDLSALELE